MLYGIVQHLNVCVGGCVYSMHRVGEICMHQNRSQCMFLV